jgi:prolipoprotein diacylglyceryltransferase
VVAVRYVAGLIGGRPFSPLALLAALAIGYVFGEGVGRLACVSFGCCYGKPLHRLAPRSRRLLERLSFTFHGETKKIAYENGWHGIKVVPIQAMTSVALTGCALAATWLFLSGRFGAAFALAVAFSQGWRALSETLRGDHRGGGERASAYQVMALAGGLYALAVAPLFGGGPTGRPDLMAGIACVWDPLVLVALQLVGLGVFLLTGCSKVTGCSLSFHVRRHEI